VQVSSLEAQAIGVIGGSAEDHADLLLGAPRSFEVSAGFKW
jgi:hypothetical protein